MIEVCVMCRTPKKVPGPREKIAKGFCGSEACTIKGLLALAAQDMLERCEADDLNRLLDKDATGS